MSLRWYRTGTVAVTSGSKIVTGTGTNFLAVAQLAPGDTLTLDNSTFYEIASVESDLQITLVENYAEATLSGQTYGVIRLTGTSLSNAELAGKVSALLNKWINRENEVIAWQAGTATGGPNLDGKYPLTDPTGTVNLVLCPAAIAADTYTHAEADARYVKPGTPINATIGATTPDTGAFTTLSADSLVFADGTTQVTASGVDYIGVAYNPVTQAWQRLGAAEGLPVGAILPTNISPILANLRRVVLADDGSVYKGVSWLDFTKHEDGTAVALDGTNGQIMMEYLPAYYKTDVVGDWQRMMISHLPLPGFSLFPLFAGKDAAYRGAYEASTYLDKLCSISKSPVDGIANVYPVTTRAGAWGHAGLTAAATDTLAAARGAGWRQSHLMSVTWERILMLVAFGTYNIPGVTGVGRTNLSGGLWENDSYIGKLGLGDAAAGLYSAVQAGGTAGFLTDYSTCLGIENSWGHIWERVQSLVSDWDVYHGGTDYASTAGWTRLLDADGVGITLPAVNGYAGTPHSGLGLWLPDDVTGASTSGMFDYFYQAGGLRVLLVGGNAYYGTDAGPFCVLAGSSAAYTYTSVGGRLCFERSTSA